MAEEHRPGHLRAMRAKLNLPAIVTSAPVRTVAFEDGVTLLWQRSRKQLLNLDEGLGVVQTREGFCWICVGAAKVGYVHFTEYDILPATMNDEFMEEMEISSLDDFQLGEAVTSCWIVDEIADIGAVVELKRGWMAPGLVRDGLWARGVEYLIKKLYAKAAAVLVLKAYPLEYESIKFSEDVEATFERRRRAMFRHYRRHLGVELLPGPAGIDGWMWRPLKLGAPIPALK